MNRVLIIFIILFVEIKRFELIELIQSFFRSFSYLKIQNPIKIEILFLLGGYKSVIINIKSVHSRLYVCTIL